MSTLKKQKADGSWEFITTENDLLAQHITDNVNSLVVVNANIATNTNNIATNTNNITSNTTNLSELKQYTTLKSGKDTEGIFVTYQRKRYDGTLLMSSILSGGTTPLYTTRTETWYASNGTTVVSTRAYTITYDVDGVVVSEV